MSAAEFEAVAVEREFVGPGVAWYRVTVVRGEREIWTTSVAVSLVSGTKVAFATRRDRAVRQPPYPVRRRIEHVAVDAVLLPGGIS